jgi:hypothetical protein
MSEATDGPLPDGDSRPAHPQDPAEGPDEQAEAEPNVPRVHPEDPAEGPPLDRPA